MASFFRTGKNAGPPALLTGLLVLNTLGFLGHAALTSQEQMKPLRYEVSVVLKLIHVYVTDKKGNPIPDLARDDFAVFDNGQPMTVTAFERHALEPAAKNPGPEAPAPGKSLPPAIQPSALNRKFFLFLDMAFNNARGIAKAKTAALHFLDTQIKPDDEVGLLSYSMFKGVTVHEYLTTAHGKIREVLNKIDQRGIAGRASEIEDWYWRLAQEPVPSSSSPPTQPDTAPVPKAPAQSIYLSEARGQRDESKRIAQTFILRMTALAKALRYIPGQKQFILFSTGVPSSIIYGNQAGNPNDWTGRSLFDPGDRTIRTQNEDMYREFSASGCTFYAFDTRESAKVANLFGYDEMTFEMGSRTIEGAQDVFQDSKDVFRDDKTTGLNSLKRLTDITGGKYYSNINRYEKNLDQVQSLTGTYYVLGYSIGEASDGQFHETRVEVKRKGCEVRAQAGYFNPKPYKDYTALEKQLHLFDLALNERSFSRIPARFPLMTLSYAAGSEACLEILATVPAEVMARFAGKRAEFFSVVFDAKDNVSDLRRFECNPEGYSGRAVTFVAEAALKPGDYSCRLILRDMETGMSAVASARGTVGAARPSGLELHTPLLLTENSGSALLEAGAAKAKGLLSWRDVYPFDQTVLSPCAGEVPKGAQKIIFIVPCSIPGETPTDLAFAAQLMNSVSGEKLEVPFALIGRVQLGSLEILTMEFPVGGLPPGGYLLYVFAEDRASKALSHVQAPLAVPKR